MWKGEWIWHEWAFEGGGFWGIVLEYGEGDGECGDKRSMKGDTMRMGVLLGDEGRGGGGCTFLIIGQIYCGLYRKRDRPRCLKLKACWPWYQAPPPKVMYDVVGGIII